MHRLQKIGNDTILELTPAMLKHLGLTDAVEVSMEQGKIVLTAPPGPAPRRRMSFQDAKEATFEKYDSAMKRLADAG